MISLLLLSIVYCVCDLTYITRYCMVRGHQSRLLNWLRFFPDFSFGYRTLGSALASLVFFVSGVRRRPPSNSAHSRPSAFLLILSVFFSVFAVN